MSKNYYKILEVDRSASSEVIEKAFKALAMKYHPDKWPPDQHSWATAKMQELNDAYRILSKPELRRQYDASLTDAVSWELFLEEGLLGIYHAWRTQR